MRKSLYVSTAFLALALWGCSAQQVQNAVATAQTTQQEIQTALNSACADVAQAETDVNSFGLGADATVQNIEGYATGACVGGTALASFVTATVSNPSNVSWVENLAADLNKFAPAKPATPAS